jgi:hypothetical protein
MEQRYQASEYHWRIVIMKLGRVAKHSSNKDQSSKTARQCPERNDDIADFRLRRVAVSKKMG